MQSRPDLTDSWLIDLALEICLWALVCHLMALAFQPIITTGSEKISRPSRLAFMAAPGPEKPTIADSLVCGGRGDE